jgi:hypothetical protein
LLSKLAKLTTKLIDGGLRNTLKKSLELISIGLAIVVNSLGSILTAEVTFHGTICGANKAADPVRRIRAISPARI